MDSEGKGKELDDWVAEEKKRDRQVGDEERGKELDKWTVKKRKKSWASGF